MSIFRKWWGIHRGAFSQFPLKVEWFLLCWKWGRDSHHRCRRLYASFLHIPKLNLKLCEVSCSPGPCFPLTDTSANCVTALHEGQAVPRDGDYSIKIISIIDLHGIWSKCILRGKIQWHQSRKLGTGTIFQHVYTLPCVSVTLLQYKYANYIP